jgi:hypothetical protein
MPPQLQQFLNNTLLMSALSAVAAALVTNFVAVYRTRVRVLEYTVHHDRVGLAANDATFGNVAVTWQGNPVQNLYASTVRIVNQTSADYTNLRFYVFSGDATLLLNDRAFITDSTYVTRYTEEWLNSIAVPPGQEPTAAHWHTYLHSREFLVDVFNRGQTFEVTFLTTVPEAKGGPTVWVDLRHQGLKIKFKTLESEMLGVPVKLALPIGWLATLIMLVAVSLLTTRVWLAAGISLIAGLAVQTIGAAIYRVGRFLHGIVFR